MQATHRSRRILLPAKRWFIYVSLFMAMMIDFMPLGSYPGVPDFTALVLIFWSIRETERVGVGTAFICGLIIDVGHGAALGQHACAYVLLAYVAQLRSRRILWFAPLEQAMHILPMLLGVEAIMLLVRLVGGAAFPGPWILLGAISGTILWPFIYAILLMPQYRPESRDENRPI